MGRVRRVAWLLPVLVAACADDPAATDAIEPVSTTSSSTVAVTTTTAVADDQPVDICGRGLIWEVGVTYTARCFGLPITIDSAEAGWRSRGATEDDILLTWIDPLGNRSANIGVLLVRGTPAETLERFVSNPNLRVVDSIEQTSVAGFDAQVVDLEGAASNVSVDQGSCSEARFGGIYFTSDDSGWTLVAPRGRSGAFVYGVGACQVVRAWVFGVDAAQTIVILAGTVDPDEHEQAVAAAELLFGTLAIGSGAAVPADG